MQQGEELLPILGLAQEEGGKAFEQGRFGRTRGRVHGRGWATEIGDGEPGRPTGTAQAA